MVPTISLSQGLYTAGKTGSGKNNEIDLLVDFEILHGTMHALGLPINP